MLERNGVREAAIIHDAILLEEPGLIASVASAMRLAVENDRLTAEVEAQLTGGGPALRAPGSSRRGRSRAQTGRARPP